MNSQKIKDPVGWPDFTYPVTITGQTLYIAVDIVAQTIPVLNIHIESVESGVLFDVSIRDSQVTLNVNVTNSSLDVYITNTSLNVNVTNATLTVTVSGTVNVNVTNSTLTVQITGTPTINIQTTSGANIVIDKLTVGAYTEDRRTLQNNGTSAAMVTSNYSVRRGKFFPRGCRGFIGSVDIYCSNADSASHTFTIYFAIQPGMAPVFSVSLTVAGGSSAAWRSATVGKFWNYDSMFIYVRCDNDTYGAIGYDNGTPYDYYYSSDEVVWTPGSYRFWIRVNMTGETVGDLPVSGTVNTIEVPPASTCRQVAILSVPADSTVYDTEIRGTGRIKYIIYGVSSAEAANYLCPSLIIDGSLAIPVHATFNGWLTFVGDAQNGIYLSRYDTVNNFYSFVIQLDLAFKNSFRVGFYNSSPSKQYTGQVTYIYEKIG